MSKSLGNIFDPWEALDRQGADALRWFMLTNGSPWTSRRIGHEVLDDVLRQFLLTLWNVYAFFVTYANADGFDPSRESPPARRPSALDRWAISQLHRTIRRRAATASTAMTPPAPGGASRRSSTTCPIGTCDVRAGGSGIPAGRRARSDGRLPHAP